MNAMTSIKSAAIIHNGKTWTGYRHHLIIRDIVQMLGPEVAPVNGEEGFITGGGEFVDRKMAAKIAFEAGQIPLPHKTLYSEDIFRACGCRFYGQFVDGVCNECGLRE